MHCDACEAIADDYGAGIYCIPCAEREKALDAYFEQLEKKELRKYSDCGLCGEPCWGTCTKPHQIFA